MITVKVMFDAAADRYRETGKIPSKQWVNKHGGSIYNQTMDSETEYKPFVIKIEEVFVNCNWICVVIANTELPVCSSCQK